VNTVSDPDLTPSEEQVRRLLADARHDEPMPADVVDRLDRALADLRGEFRRTPDPTDLAARRRRRFARNLLVAAAAVVVVGVGISRVDLSGQADSDASSDSGAASAPQETAHDQEAGGDSLLVTRRPLVLSSEDFDQRVRLRADLDAAEAPDALVDGHSASASQPYDDLGRTLSKSITWCNDPAWGTGKRIPVRYDGKRGVLVLRPPSGGSRAADLYLCGAIVATRSTTVPAG
jgi:hypothetical protein